MSTRHLLRMTAVAAATTLAGFGAQAIEATQWDPQAEVHPSASNDATLNPIATAVQVGEATVFHDAVAHDTVATRDEIRNELREWQARGLVDDAGEAGATERVLAERHAFAESERQRLMASNTQGEASIDPIAELAVQTALVDARDGTPSYGLAVEDESLRMPANQFPETPQPMGPDEQWRDEHIIAEGPSYIDTRSGAMTEPTTVAMR